MPQTLEAWLDDLASPSPTPGGGAAAALLAATGAALVGMVTNLTIGNPRYESAEPLMIRVRDEAAELRTRALGLAAADETAFGAVIAAYKLPKGDERTAAIQTALSGAARVPLELAGSAARVIALAESVVDDANPNVISDVAVAADAARAALTSARVNVEINIAALRDPAVVAALSAELAAHLAAVDVADRVSARVREKIAQGAQ